MPDNMMARSLSTSWGSLMQYSAWRGAPARGFRFRRRHNFLHPGGASAIARNGA
jgi:hypothetical protein